MYICACGIHLKSGIQNLEKFWYVLFFIIIYRKVFGEFIAVYIIVGNNIWRPFYFFYIKVFKMFYYLCINNEQSLTLFKLCPGFFPSLSSF